MRENYFGFNSSKSGQDGDFTPSESLMGPALLKTRRAFTDNARGGIEINLKAGKVDSRVLGRRVGTGDPRLFHRRTRPGKRSYFVLIMMDISGSTAGQNILIMKQAVMAQATLLQRAGVPFAIYAQSGQVHSIRRIDNSHELDLEIYIIKEAHQPWDKNTQEALTTIGPDAANLDGHALEYARKRVEEVQATDRIILYYSDGKMPAENHDEELEILQREIRYCRHRSITLLGVGIRTDSPARHGLETVQLDTIADTGKVVDQLKKYLVRKTTG
jgi:nitric oxide reductase activation protein